MSPTYAVTATQDEGPVAVFATLEDARTWATLRFGPGAFQIAEVFTHVSPSSPRRRRSA